MIQIKKDIIAEIKAHAQCALPNEACGYLAGNDGIITQIFKLTNIDHSPEHFSCDPAEQFETLKTTFKEGLQILANYHSHPQTAARPSEEDIKLAYDPEISYIIISLAQEEITIKSFRITNSIAEKEEIIIIE